MIDMPYFEDIRDRFRDEHFPGFGFGPGVKATDTVEHPNLGTVTLTLSFERRWGADNSEGAKATLDVEGVLSQERLAYAWRVQFFHVDGGNLPKDAHPAIRKAGTTGPFKSPPRTHFKSDEDIRHHTVDAVKFAWRESLREMVEGSKLGTLLKLHAVTRYYPSRYAETMAVMDGIEEAWTAMAAALIGAN